MNAALAFAGMELLGSAEPFVPRMQQVLQAISAFEDFDEADLQSLARHMNCYRVGPGTAIIHEGEVGDFMVLVLDGLLEIQKQDMRGQPTVLATVGPGKSLGEMSLIDTEPRFATCVSLNEVTFAVLDRESLSLLITDQPLIGVKLMMEFLMQTNERLRTVSDQLMQCMEARRQRVR